MVVLVMLVAMYTIPGVEDIEFMTKAKGWMDGVMKNQQQDYQFVDYNKNPASDCTCLIIDARDTGYKPAVNFLVKTSEGKIIYNSLDVAYRFVNENGRAFYAGSIEAALNLKNIGSKPVIVRAIGVDPVKQEDLILRPIDGINIIRATMDNDVLKHSRIAIITD